MTSKFQNPKSKIQNVPVLAVTAGDPCGIGPEVILKNLAHGLSRRARLVIIGDLAVFERAARRLHRRPFDVAQGRPERAKSFDRLRMVSKVEPRVEGRLPPWQVLTDPDAVGSTSSPITFLDVAHRAVFRPGRSSASAGRASLDYLDTAITLWRRGWAQALVTAPVTKWSIARTHPRFVGQTEYLANATRATSPVMMFVSSRLRIVLLTRHRALRDVASQVTRPLVRSTLEVTVQGLRTYFGLRRPRIAICGLNPHGGERGAFGDEERRILAPVLKALGTECARIEGPFSADGFFADGPSAVGTSSAARMVPPRSAAWRGYDAVVCWYHDQGLIPFKMMARDRGCQLTLGLPFIRTSPDHGSALDIAGKGRANPGSMRYALELAARLASIRGHKPIF